MLRFVYLLISFVLLMLILILFFQNIKQTTLFDFFSSYVSAGSFVFYMIFMSFLCGLFLALWINGILSNSKQVEDDFNL